MSVRFYDAAWFSNALNVERAAVTIFKARHGCFDFHDREPNRCDAESSVCSGEHFALDDARVVADRDELHLIARDLMMRAISDDEPTGDDTLTGEIAEITNGAIRLPRNTGELVQRMSTHREPEQLHFITVTLWAIRLSEGGCRQR